MDWVRDETIDQRRLGQEEGPRQENLRGFLEVRKVLVGLLGSCFKRYDEGSMGARGLPACANCGASSPLAVVVNFERRSVPLLRMAFRRASAFAAADMVMVGRDEEAGQATRRV